MVNIEKWINELQIAVADLARKVSAAAGALKPTITDPVEGQAIIYDGTGWVNGSVAPPAPEPATEIVIISHDGTKYTTEKPIIVSDVVAKTFTDTTALYIKAGGGNFTTYVRSEYAYDITAVDSVSLSYMRGGNITTENVLLSSFSDIEDEMYVGMYYETDNNGYSIGVFVSTVLEPQNMQLHELYRGSGASGDIGCAALKFFKTETNSTKRRKTK